MIMLQETGVGIKQPLFFIGVVENNIDERLEGRVQVRAFGVHGSNKQVPTDSLPWATLIHGSYDPNDPIPPLNSFVFGFFLDGRDAQQPMILGLIPKQYLTVIDPEILGWGTVPAEDQRILSKGTDPDSVGEPQNSKLVRGESLENTHVLQLETNRVKDVSVAKTDEEDPEDNPEEVSSWEEPTNAYNAEYPYNRVIETAKHSIELDDTPGAERVMIRHEQGSYISMDSRGTTVYKATSDSYDINDMNRHLYVGGRSLVTIVGDSRVRIEGNKVEEIEGNLIQVVRGNHMLSVGGQSNINASEEVQIRGAKIRAEANVEGINLKAGRDIKIQSGEFTYLKAGATTVLEAADAINLNAAGDNINIQAAGDLNVKSATAYMTADGALDLKGGHVKIGGGTKVSIDASLVAIDDIIQLAEGQAVAPDAAAEAATSVDAEGVEAPEPAAKSTSTKSYKTTPSRGSSGVASRDTSTTEPTTSRDENGVPPKVGASSPPGTPLTAEQEEAAWKKLEEQERERRLAAGLPAEFSDEERRALKGIMSAEGGDQAANLATVLNRSYQAGSPVHHVVMANSQFTPATSYLQGYRDRIAGVDEEGFRRFTGAAESSATTSFADAIDRYKTIPQYDKINYFVGRGLNVQFGTLAYTAGNQYSVGQGGKFFANGGATNWQKYQEYLNRNN